MKILRLLGLLLLFGPAFAIRGVWSEQTLNGTPVHVLSTTQVDIAFNNSGQIAGWFIKNVRGTQFHGVYTNAPNLVPKNLPLPGTLSGFHPTQATFSKEGSSLIARFSQGSTELIYRLNPVYLSLQVTVRSSTPRTLFWSGLGTSDHPLTKFLPQGGQAPQPEGQGAARYIAWQSAPTQGDAMILEPLSGTLNAQLVSQGSGAVAKIQVPPGQPLRFRAYGGPNEMVRLQEEGYLNLPGLFQPNLLGYISLILLLIMEAAFRLSGSWAFAILALTLVVRLALWPLMHRQYKSMAEMNKIKPLVDEINQKYKNDPEKRTQATMQLYQEYKINPFSGCLPLFLQLPILLVLWRVIANFEFNQGFLWIPDLALPDPHYILPILYVLTMMASTYLSSGGNREVMRQGMIMNLIFVFLVLSFPSGVSLYWVLSTLISLVQQWLINRSLGIKPASASKS
jgi:YidC/Oxa1 family membrane protein insertase